MSSNGRHTTDVGEGHVDERDLANDVGNVHVVIGATLIDVGRVHVDVWGFIIDLKIGHGAGGFHVTVTRNASEKEKTRPLCFVSSVEKYTCLFGRVRRERELDGYA
jgi:hypothetical protein